MLPEIPAIVFDNGREIFDNDPGISPRQSVRRMKRKLQITKAARFLAAALLAYAILAPQGCRSKAAPRNLILITLDTLRADHVSAISRGKASTPYLDALAAEGILFKNCYSLIPITMPSHASLFFSERPYQLKNYNNGQILYNKRNIPSLASLFEKNAFDTAAFVSLGVVRATFGLNKGFQTYADQFPADRWYLSAEEVNRRVLPWLEAHRERPFFLWVHYSDPHEPYILPGATDDMEISVNGSPVGSYCLSKYTINKAEIPLRAGMNEIRFDFKNEFEDAFPYQARLDLFQLEAPQDPTGLKIERYRDVYFREADGTYFFKNKSMLFVSNSGTPRRAGITFRGKLILPVEITRRNYRREVEYMDGEIGRLRNKLQELGLMSNTAIVAVGDHGEGLGEYLTDDLIRYIGHIHFLQDIYMRVPLILFTPAGKKTPAVREEFATLLDIAPTITAIMGLKKPSHFQGRNLIALPKDEPLEIFEETYRPEAEKDRFGILAYPWHLIFTPEIRRFEAYHLVKDPEEVSNLFGKEAFPPDIEALKRKLEDRTREILKSKESVKVDKNVEDMLRSLGYIK